MASYRQDAHEPVAMAHGLSRPLLGNERMNVMVPPATRPTRAGTTFRLGPHP